MKKTIEYGNITLMDEVETEEANRLLKKMKQRYIWLVIIPLILFLIVEFLAIPIGLVFTIPAIFLAIFIICLIAYLKILSPYYKLKKIAKFNDKIRHEEKIRVRERKRLEQTESEEVPQIKRSDIENTFEKMDIQQ